MRTSYSKTIFMERVMIRKFKNRRFYEARFKKGIKSVFDDYDKTIGSGISPYLIYDIHNRENGLSLPNFSANEIRSVQNAVDNADISLCMDVVDKIDDYLEEYKRRKRQVEPIDNQLQELWEQYLDNVKAVGKDVIFSHDGDWLSPAEGKEFNPMFYAIEWNPDAEEHLMNLRDAILDLF